MEMAKKKMVASINPQNPSTSEELVEI